MLRATGMFLAGDGLGGDDDEDEDMEGGAAASGDLASPVLSSFSLKARRSTVPTFERGAALIAPPRPISRCRHLPSLRPRCLTGQADIEAAKEEQDQLMSVHVGLSRRLSALLASRPRTGLVEDFQARTCAGLLVPGSDARARRAPPHAGRRHRAAASRGYCWHNSLESA